MSCNNLHWENNLKRVYICIYPMPKVRGDGREVQPHIQGAVAAWAQEGRQELLQVQVEKRPFVQGKEQQLCFAGVAMKEIPHLQGKRNPSKMVGVVRGHQRADTLKP